MQGSVQGDIGSPDAGKGGTGRAGTNMASNTTGFRSSRHKRGMLRRHSIVVKVTGIAFVLVAIVTAVAYMLSPAGSGANGLAQVLNSLPHSKSIAALEAERQQIITMNAAARALSQGSRPQVVNPSQIMASDGMTMPGGSTGSDTGTPIAAPDPGTAQKIGFDLLPSYGFDQTSQWSCLERLWQRESSWTFDAENPSGAYGIPQALPGSKMASAGADWMTNPTTQIKWGLGYIKSLYGTPCNAWAHEEADNFY